MAKKKPKRPKRRTIQAARTQEQVAADLLSQGKLLQALETLDDIISSGRATGQTWQLTGKGLVLAGENAQAIGALEHALEFDSDDLLLSFQVGGYTQAVDNVFAGAVI